MVNQIGNYNSYMNYLRIQAPRNGPDPSEMFNKMDTDSSSGISQSELETFAENISSKTGTSIETTDAVTTYDADGDSELSSDELKSFMEATMGPPMGMKRMHGGHRSEDLFTAIDTDSSSGVSQSELDEWAEAMFDETGNSIETTDAVSTYDVDGDDELSSEELKSFMEATMAPPMGMMEGVSSNDTSSSESADSVISAYDTNGDGVLSSDELQAYLDDTDTTSFRALMQQALSAYTMNFRSSLFSNPETIPLNFGGFNGYSSFGFSI
jgi:Ca2+-binding EF-hand superfamily protein